MCDSCEKTEFGCCPDLNNAALGPAFEGCPDEDGSGGFVDCELTVRIGHLHKGDLRHSIFFSLGGGNSVIKCKWRHLMREIE